MAANPVLLCIHRDPDRMRVLQGNGYELLSAATGQDALGLLGTRPVDAIVLEYYSQGLFDASAVASEIKQVRPNIPIVMLAEPEELPVSSQHLVDILVSKSDPPHFVWAAVHFALSMRQGVNFGPASRAIQVLECASKSRASGRRREMSNGQTSRCDMKIA